MKGKLMTFFGLSVALVVLTSAWAVADVKVSTIGTYTDTQLTLNIYADTTDTTNGAAAPLVSYGIKVAYSDTDLTLTSAQKNETDWYFGTPGGTIHPYVDPDTSVAGQVVILGGKINETAPTEGVSGTQVLLGSLVFSRNNTNTPAVSVELGKPEPSFANFVTNDGKELDDTNRLAFLPPEITEECVLTGDLNNDGIVNMSDIYVIQDNWGASGPNLPADLNNDNIVNMSDIYVIQDNWGKQCP